MRSARSLRPALAVGAVAAVIAVVGVATPAPAITLTPTFAEWSSPTAATLDGVGVTVESGAALDSFDMSDASYDPPGSATQETTNYDANVELRVSFAQPIVDVALYLKYLRGSLVGGPTSYTLGSTGGCTWSIQSGLSGAVLTGDSLDVTGLNYLDGILLCTGTASQVTMAPDSEANSLQAVTIATFGGVEPSTTTTTAPSTTTTTASPAVAADTVSPSFTG